MNMNKNRDWLIRKAEQEDGCFVSVGGLVEALEQADHRAECLVCSTAERIEQEICGRSAPRGTTCQRRGSAMLKGEK